MARMKAQTRSMAKKTKIPPWGALEAAPRAIDRAPVVAPPTIIEGITRNGSAAANGMAPSEMKEAPILHPALPVPRSACLNLYRPMVVDSAMASGGTIPAAMTAAITLRDPTLVTARFVVAKR